MRSFLLLLEDHIPGLFLIIAISIIVILLGSCETSSVEPEVQYNSPEPEIELTDAEKLAQISDEVLLAIEQNFDLAYLHITNISNTTIYEFSYNEITSSNLYTNEQEVKIIISNLYQTISKIWLESYIDRYIIISLVDYSNHDLVLLMSENYSITYSVNDVQKIETTREDWLNLFKYYYNREPEEQELNDFIDSMELDYE